MELNWQNAGGKLPEGWTVVPLRDFLVNEKSVSVGVMYPGKHDENGVPLIKVGDVKNGKIEGTPESRISSEVDEEYKRTRLSGDELLITLVGNPGECVIVQPHMKGWNAARALAVLRLKNPDTRQWLNMVLQSRPLKHIIDSRLNTTVQKTLNLKDVKELPIPIPDIGTDTFCRHYYDLERKITLNRQINQTLEQMAQTLFKSWFVDFDPVIDNALDAGNPIPDELQQHADARKAVRESEGFKPLPNDVRQLFPDAFEESELGWVPKGWVVSTVSDIAHINSKSWSKKSAPEAVEYVDLSNAKNGVILDTDIYLFEEAPSRARRILNKKDTIFGLVRPANRSFAFVDRDGLTGSTGFAVVKAKKSNCPSFIYQLLTSDNIVELFIRIADGAAYPAIKPDDIADVQFAMPNSEVLSHYEVVTNSYRERTGLGLTNNICLAKLRDTLLPKLISGELRLDDVEAAVEQETVSA
ncbi:restriction endonuclease subunit S [Enterovibrio norvegicus]|uniref:restriction endonuclease subunit S n=1 Tax=Enterovibrio norvegicus TaxID=188144 RepID=UPI001E4CB403|nr:restriction endonuclease subunit S [Enterovibrio norvegicus]MCC4799631.1 restriction endonuclease subunit S [Enterovibrio norvegicus]